MSSAPFSPTPPTEAEWVLIVDDDEPVRTMVRSIILPAGPAVETAGSVAEAWSILRRRGDDPLLIISDVMMPGVDGIAFMRELKAYAPRTKLALMSGHLHDVSWWPQDLREVEFIPKPFRLAEILALVAVARIERAK